MFGDPPEGKENIDTWFEGRDFEYFLSVMVAVSEAYRGGIFMPRPRDNFACVVSKVDYVGMF
jgi:hypothetical protein